MSVQVKGSGTIGGLDEGLVVSGIVTSSTQINVGSNIKLGNAGVVTATSFVGSGANLTSLPAQATIANNADNRVITGGSGVNLNGEANLTFNGSNLQFNTTANGNAVILKSTGNHYTKLSFDSNNTSAGGELAYIDFSWDGDKVADIFAEAGSDTTNKDDGHLVFRTSPQQGNIAERLRITSAGNVGINETSPDSLLHVTTNSSTAYSTSEVNTVNSTNALLRLENTNGGDGSGVNNYVGIYFRVANGANSDSQLQYVRTGDNAGTFHFKARNAGSTYPNLMAIKSDGNTGFNGTIDPKSTIHFGSNQDLRIGSQYGGLSQIMEQVEYTAGYTGTHWQFETNNMISWSFDGVLIVYGGGGSSYGSEVVKITIVYSRESGANNSGDIWRNGTTSYNIETLGHGQTGLSPSSGSLTVTEDTAPDGAASTRSLFKLGWSSAATGGSTTVWSKLHGTIYWGTGSSGDVEIQDKDGNIFWDSNP